jgi:hypothetical protein
MRYRATLKSRDGVAEDGMAAEDGVADGAVSAPDWLLVQSSVGCWLRRTIGGHITMIPESIIAYDGSGRTIRTVEPIWDTTDTDIRALEPSLLWAVLLFKRGLFYQ